MTRNENCELCIVNEEHLLQGGQNFLGAAAGSPYIVFISTSGMLRSSDIYIYIYIYIIRVPTRNRNNKFIL